MIKTIASVGLPVDEVLEIKKNRISPDEPVAGCKRISIVTGIHGDELEGQYVCYKLNRRIQKEPEKLTEIPQIRINELHKEMLVPLAKELNVDFVWVHGANTVLEATFAHSLNSRNVPTLVVEMGVGMRITKTYGDQLVDGIFHLMHEMGIWQGETSDVRTPIISEDPEDVSYLNATRGGIFVPNVKHWETLKKGELVGKIIDPLLGEVVDEIVSPVDGILFTIREYPVVDEGSLIGRLLRKEVYDR